MEKLKRFFSSLMFGLMAVCAMTLSACSDDDDVTDFKSFV